MVVRNENVLGRGKNLWGISLFASASIPYKLFIYLDLATGKVNNNRQREEENLVWGWKGEYGQMHRNGSISLKYI